jgi:hypothetical protein
VSAPASECAGGSKEKKECCGRTEKKVDDGGIPPEKFLIMRIKKVGFLKTKII